VARELGNLDGAEELRHEAAASSQHGAEDSVLSRPPGSCGRQATAEDTAVLAGSAMGWAGALRHLVTVNPLSGIPLLGCLSWGGRCR
jgi:hypothetical protein